MAERPRTRLDPDVRREQILAAASELFGTEDYSEVSLERIAEAAGVTRGLLHHYFGSKRALFVEVVAEGARVPAGVRLVPAGLQDAPLDTVIDACVGAWMALMGGTGRLWLGATDTVGIRGRDLDEVINAARDDLVERILEEFPFPPELDTDLLRSALRSYSAFARVTTEEWLVERTLSEQQTATMLSSALRSLIVDVVPDMMRVT